MSEQAVVDQVGINSALAKPAPPNPDGGMAWDEVAVVGVGRKRSGLVRIYTITAP